MLYVLKSRHQSFNLDAADPGIMGCDIVRTARSVDPCFPHRVQTPQSRAWGVDSFEALAGLCVNQNPKRATK